MTTKTDVGGAVAGALASKIRATWQRGYEQGGAVYLCLVAWAIYAVLAPRIHEMDARLGLLFVLFPGLYLSSLVIYLQHESWHNYFGKPRSRAFFLVLSALVFVLPYQYDLAHRTHHAKVNTYGDLEFYPIGKIERRSLRIACNCMSLMFGSLFLLLLGMNQPSGMSAGRTLVQTVVALAASCAVWLGVGLLAHHVAGASMHAIVVTDLMTIWLVSVFHHHNELIEHGNLIAEGDFRFRSSQTRNLDSQGFLAKVVLFFAHQDSREHTLHHTDVSVYSRPFTGRYPMPVGATHITLLDYVGIMKSMVLGRENVVRQAPLPGVDAALPAVDPTPISNP